MTNGPIIYLGSMTQASYEAIGRAIFLNQDDRDSHRQVYIAIEIYVHNA
jgi:hypothetical protein